MNWNDIKKIIKKEVLKEATTVNAGNTKFNLRTGVNKNPTKLGLKAKARTKELLEKVSSKSGYFRIKSYGLGKYGRVLAEVFIMDKDGKQWNVNETLISEGHAYVYDGGKKKVFTS